MEQSPIHERLRLVTAGWSFRQLGAATGVHPETVRRYMQGHSPSAEFLCGLCAALGVNGDWLLTGRGSMRAGEAGPAPDTRRAHDVAGAFATIILDLIHLLERIQGPGASSPAIQDARAIALATPQSPQQESNGTSRRRPGRVRK